MERSPTKIQAIYRARICKKYNIRPCNREKKGNRHETIKNNEKNRRKQSKNNAPGDRAPRGNKKTTDELRRRLSH
jgi:ribosomal protein L44E